MGAAKKTSVTKVQAFLFGVMQIEKNGKKISLPASTTARSLLAYLLFNNRPSHTRAALTGLFWPELDEARARRALSQALWQIRRSVGELVDVAAETISITREIEVWVDAQAFEQMTNPARGASQQNEAARQNLEQALELHRADFLEDDFHDWALFERERLRERHLQVLERLEDMEKAAGRFAKALELAQQLSRADPLNEPACREIMRLHQLLHQPEAALRQFELCRQTLRQELNTEPEAETLALAEEIRRRTEKGQPSQESLVPAPLVGREAERAALLRFVEGIFNNMGGLVLLEGEAGVGKTRLLQEVVREAEWRGAQVLWGHAREAQGLKPYAPLVEALQSGLSPLRVAQIGHAVERVWLQALAPLLSPHPALSAFESAPSLAPAQERARLVEAIHHLLEGWSGIVPLVVLLEDLHWADGDTLDLLPTLARRLGRVGVLIVGSYRGEEARARPEVWEAMRAVSHGSLLERRVLSRLDESATGELIRRSLGLASPAPLFEVRLFRETDGNPLFVLETLRALRDEGLLVRDESGGWSTPWDETTRDYAELPLPPLVEKVITGRLDLLPADARRLLDLMAILGPRFDFGLLGGVADLEIPTLLKWTRELIRRAFLEETESGYHFGHDKIHQVVYEGMETRDRIRFHRRAAAYLQEARPEEIGALAHHYWEAQKWSDAARCHQQAGERAAEVYANAEAMNHFNRALEANQKLSGSPDLRQVYSIRLAREKIFDLRGERESQTLELDALAGLAEDLDDDRCRAEVALRRARQADLTCDFPKSITAASRATQLARAANVPTIEIESNMEWGWCLLLQGEHDAARSRFEQALSLTRSNGLKRLEADALHGVGTVGLVTGNYLEANNYFHQVLEICRQVDIRPREGSTLANLAYIAAAQGDHTASQSYNEQALRLHRETGDQRGAALVMQASSEYFLSEGKFSVAQEYMENALTIQEAIQARDNIGVTLRSLGVLYHRLGDYDRAMDNYERAQAIFVEIGIPYYQGQTLAYMSLLSHHLGKDQTALEQSQQGLEIVRKINDRLGEGLLLDCLGHAHTGLGQLAQAAEAYQMALGLHQELNDLNMTAESRAGLARLALQGGDLVAATEQVEEILTIQNNGGIGNVNEPFRVQLTCYRVLNASRDPRAADILRAAHEQLLAQKANIKDARLESSFLEAVAAHREIVAASAQNQGKKVTVRLPRVGDAAKTVHVTWTVSAPGDDQIQGKVEQRRRRLERLLKEAAEQGGNPTYQQLAKTLGASLRTIERDMADLKNKMAG